MCFQYRFLSKPFQATENQFGLMGKTKRALSLTVFLHQSKRFCIPSIFDIGWLDVKMPVDADSFFAWVWSQSAQDDGRQRDLVSGGQLRGQRWAISWQASSLLFGAVCTQISPSASQCPPAPLRRPAVWCPPLPTASSSWSRRASPAMQTHSGLAPSRQGATENGITTTVTFKSCHPV